MKFLTSCLTLCIAALLAASCFAQRPGKTPETFLKDGKLDLDAVVKHFEDLYRSKSSISVMDLTVTRPGSTRTMTMNAWTRGRDKALIIIEQPVREAGTATLKVDKNLWNYMPHIKRTIRIPPSMMLASWMGTDLTNDDLVRESSFIDDYNYRLLGPSRDQAGWVVRFDAKPGLVGLWNRIDLTVSRDGTIPIMAQYYDRRNRLARTMRWDDVRVFDGRSLPAHMTLVPEDEPGHKTEVRYQSIQFDVDVPESTFSLSTLEQQR